MTTKYYLNKNLEWVEIPELNEDKSIAQTFPQNYTFGIDEALDVAEFSFFAPEKYHIPVDSIIKINNDEIIKYWIVKDSKSAKMQYPNIWTQQMQRLNTLTLVEPIDLLRGFKVEPCAFAENSYTLEQIIKRLFDIANFDAEVEIPNINYNNPKLTYVSTTLYLVAFEIARTIDCIPYLDFNETTKKWILKFQKLDGLNGKEYDISIFSNPKDFVTEIGEGLAKNVYCEVKNVNIGLTRFPSLGSRKIGNIDGSYKITLENIGIKTNNNISNLLDVRLYGYEYNTDSIDYNNYFFLYNNVNLIYYTGTPTATNIINVKQREILVKILKFDDYEILSQEEKTNKNIMYIYYTNDGIIYLNDLSKIWIENDVIFKSSKSNDFLWSDLGGVINNPTNYPTGHINVVNINYSNLNFYIEYKSILSLMPLIISNNSKYDDTTNYNQTSQQVDPNRIGRVLQTYIDNMSYGSMIKSGVFYSWSEIPMPGSIIKDGNKRYLVDSITIEQKNKFVNVDAQLCLERAKRREYISANTELQVNSIPNEEIVSRLTLKIYKIFFSIQDNLSKTNKINIKKLLLNNKFRNYMFYNQFYSNNTEYKLLGDTTFSLISNNIIFNQKAISNIIWDEVNDTNGIIIPYNYTDENGYIKDNVNNKVILFNASIQDVKNYPIIDSIPSEDKIILEFSKFSKDPYEIFNFTFQINYRGVNNTIVREEYVEYLLNGVENPTYSIRLFNINIGKYDNLPSEYVAEIGSVSVSEFDEENNYISVDFTSVENIYKSIVLLLNDKPIMIKNYFEEQTGLSSFKIYLATEDGTPVRTGVMGIDPYEEESN